jgi:hypothetical protein
MQKPYLTLPPHLVMGWFVAIDSGQKQPGSFSLVPRPPMVGVRGTDEKDPVVVIKPVAETWDITQRSTGTAVPIYSRTEVVRISERSAHHIHTAKGVKEDTMMKKFALITWLAATPDVAWSFVPPTIQTNVLSSSRLMMAEGGEILNKYSR